MKVAVFADIHSNYPVFEKAIKNTKNKNIDKYLFLGDYVSDGFDADKVLDLIKTLNFDAINGNREISIIGYDSGENKEWDISIQKASMKYGHDCLSKENIKFIKSLESYKIIEIGNKKICLSHGSPYNVRDTVLNNSYEIFDKLIKDFDCDIYLFGHQHKSYFTIYNDKYFINPGSIGLPTNELPYKYCIIEITNDLIKYEAVNIEYKYNEIEKYYKNSDYYNKCPIWAEIVLNSNKSGINHPDKFIDFIREKAKQENLKISKNIPNDLFVRAFNEYKNNFNSQKS